MEPALCIAGAAKTLMLAVTAFTLAWTHSVERTEWKEDWAIRGGELVLTRAMVKGSGAGMDPGDGARLEDGWWVWKPELGAVPSLALAASGATVSAWRLCHAGGCEELGAEPDEAVVISVCRP